MAAEEQATVDEVINMPAQADPVALTDDTSSNHKQLAAVISTGKSKEAIVVPFIQDVLKRSIKTIEHLLKISKYH